MSGAHIVAPGETLGSAERAAAVVHASYRRDLVPITRRTAVEVWRPRKDLPPPR